MRIEIDDWAKEVVTLFIPHTPQHEEAPDLVPIDQRRMGVLPPTRTRHAPGGGGLAVRMEVLAGARDLLVLSLRWLIATHCLSPH